jgi:allantoin racemase
MATAPEPAKGATMNLNRPAPGPAAAPLRIRWLNPVGFDAYDRPIGELLAGIAQPGTEVEVVSFDMPSSPSHLEYRCYEALMAERIVACSRDAAVAGVDALVIGCFYDPFIEDAREISGQTVVVAPCGACLSVAAQLANRYSILVGRDKWVEQMRERVQWYGQGSRIASFRSLGMGVDDFQRDHGLTRGRIIDAARRAVEDDQAEAIVLGCTIEFGFYQEVQAAVGVPVIDAVVAPFKQAEYLGQLKRQFGWTPSRRWSCEPPPEEELARFGLFQQPPALRRQVF